MSNTSLYLIHNNAIDRIGIRKKINDFAELLEFSILEIFKQEPLSVFKSTMRYKLEIIRINYIRIFHDIKTTGKVNLLQHSKSYLFFLLIISKFVVKIILQPQKKDLVDYRHLKIEQILTNKHISAWEEFLKTKNNIMIVFEDDALVKKDSEKRLKELLKNLKTLNFKFLFVDLAGGYKYKEVLPKKYILDIDKTNIYVKGLFTNTTCSYLMNRSLVEKLYEQYCSNKLYNNFPIDHLMNKLNTQIKNPDQTLSLHFKNPIFIHGSINREINSTLR